MSETFSGYTNSVQILNPGTLDVAIASSGTINAYGSVASYAENVGNGTHVYTIDAALWGPAPGRFTITNAGPVESQSRNTSNLFDAGLGPGCHGFDVALPTHISGNLEIRAAAGGPVLPWAKNKAA